MKAKLRSLAMAGMVPAAMLAAASIAVPAAGATAASSEAAYPPPSGQWPADWQIVVDDTQTIALAVSPGWRLIDTVPSLNADDTPRPWISATTDENAFLPADPAADTFSVPGVIYMAAPYDPDTAAVLAASEYHGTCTAEPVQAFDNGIFRGNIQAFNGCGGTATRIVQLAAHPADTAFTAYLLVQLTGQLDDAATLDGLLSSFGRHVRSA